MTDYISYLTAPKYPFQTREVERLVHQLSDSAHSYVVDGVIRWRSNDRVPFPDVVALAIHIGQSVDAAKCDTARDAENADFIAAYRKARANRSPDQIAEERSEARAAMGPDCDMVNVFTGERYTT